MVTRTSAVMYAVVSAAAFFGATTGRADDAAAQQDELVKRDGRWYVQTRKLVSFVQ